MNNYIGIDLGTSAVKLLLVREDGMILNSISKSYPLSFPHPGWSEQNPEDWVKAVKEGLKELLADIDPKTVRAIGCGGQMHGLVVLDENDQVIRPCILWNDGRTQEETDYLNDVIGKEKLSGYTANIAFAGFTAPKILWMKKHEPELFERIKKIMLPKDYINYVLTGVHCTDVSDASGMLLLDVKNRKWSEEMIEICGIAEEMLPKLFESNEAVGTLKPEIAEAFGMNSDVLVAAGAGDNAAAAIGTGTVRDGSCNISLGTSGTVFISADTFSVDPFNALHSFDHANGRYHLMGCMLSAASCHKWFVKDILEAESYDGEAVRITDDMPGNNDVFFLPYLMGERSPINDTDARGMFIGMRMDTKREDMYLAVLEGVAFAFRDMLEIAKESGIRITESMICGGGGKNPLWQKIMANVLNIRLHIPAAEEGPGYGGAMLAMVCAEAYPSVEACCDALIKVKDTVEPDPETATRYEEKYQKFRKIYPAVRQLYKEMR